MNTSNFKSPPKQGGMGGPGLQLFISVLLVIFGVVLLIASFCVPPMGVIDVSVLAAFGEILTFAGSLIGIDYHYRAKDPLNQDPLNPPA